MLDRAEASSPSVEYVIWMPAASTRCRPHRRTPDRVGVHTPLPHPPCATFRHPHADRLGIPRHRSGGPARRTLLRCRPSHRTHHPPLDRLFIGPRGAGSAGPCGAGRGGVLSGWGGGAGEGAYDAEQSPRDGAWVVELTGLLDLSGWPAGMRVIVRKERPHPGAQLRFTDTDGLRLTAFITNTCGRQLADLELRHRVAPVVRTASASAKTPG